MSATVNEANESSKCTKKWVLTAKTQQVMMTLLIAAAATVFAIAGTVYLAHGNIIPSALTYSFAVSCVYIIALRVGSVHKHFLR